MTATIGLNTLINLRNLLDEIAEKGVSPFNIEDHSGNRNVNALQEKMIVEREVLRYSIDNIIENSLPKKEFVGKSSDELIAELTGE